MAEGGGAPMDPLTNVNNGGAFLLHLLQNPSQPQPMNYRHVDPAVAAMGPTIPFDPVPVLSSSGPSYPNTFFHHGDYPQINYHQTFNIPVPAMANDLVANQGYQLGISGGIIREDGTVNLMAYEAFKRSNQQFVQAMNQNFHASSNMALDLSQSSNQQFLLNNHHQRPDLSTNQGFSNGFNGNIIPETRSQRVQNTNQGFSNGYNGDIRKVFDGRPQIQQRPIHPAQQANQFPNFDNYQGFNRSNNRNIEEMRNGMYNPRPVLKPHNSKDLGNWINERKGNSLHEENTTKLHKFEISSKKSEIGFVSSNQSNASFVASSSDNNNNNNEDLLPEQITESSLVLEEKNDTVPSKKGPYNKDHRMDSSRGFNVSSQRIRIQKRQIQCRRDIDVFAPAFVSIFESLVPSNEEMAKQRKLINSLNKLICREWPHARLHLYGSCANNFGFSNSDIDMCLAIHNAKDSDKPEIILKLAKVLEDGNLEILQALTRARVPIVKMKDPETGLSCDICINNLLAVVNTKLLKDYASIDPRLRQLVFIVKHWAKSRKVNEAYQGTLSSYAYVIMCIYYLQTRRPTILPCLQAMEKTYVVNLDNKEYAFFDKVENLQGLGARNRESISKLVWGFFQYWAYHHDYASDVISIRTGSIISKHEKDWTRRVGIDRHLICIEDPFEISHDLGRVVDKFTIKILREEFERAANILQYDPNPIVTLFEKYVPPNKNEFEDEFGDEFEGLNLN